MNAHTMTLDEIRQVGVAALVEVLGPAGAVRFLQQFDTGKGDYTDARQQILGNPTVDELIRELESQADEAGRQSDAAPPHPQLYDRLREIASAEGKPTTYQPVADLVGLDMDSPADRKRIGEMLGDISRYEHEHGRPLLSAVVVLQDSESKIPGAGFFVLAKELGLQEPGEEDYVFHARELKKVYAQWRR